MGRLLWKELHEVKWYLIGLVLGPWLLTLWPSSTLGYSTKSGRTGWDVPILLLILTFWAATRMPGEMRLNRLTVRSLPIGAWRIWAVKFLPGFIMVILLPLWIHLVAEMRVHPTYSQWDTPAKHITESFVGAASLYTVTFAASLLASSMTAVLAGWFVVFGCVEVIRGYTGYAIEESYVRVMLALIGLFVMLGIWTKARSGGIRRKVAVAAISAALAPLVGLAALLSYWAIVGGGPRGIEYGLAVLRDRPRSNRWQPYQVSGWLSTYPHYIVSPDGKSIAYRIRISIIHLRVWDSRADKMVMERKDAAPAAWLPDGNLLFVTCGSKKETMDLLEWDRVSGGVSKLASFPRSADQSYSPAMQRVVPSGDGNKVALFVSPRRGSGVDLWVLDRKSHALKLLRPGLSADWWNGVEAAWDGDRLVFRRGATYWSIRWDGSNLRRTFKPHTEANGD